MLLHLLLLHHKVIALLHHRHQDTVLLPLDLLLTWDLMVSIITITGHTLDLMLLLTCNLLPVDSPVSLTLL
jgi:hypothetical protein